MWLHSLIKEHYPCCIAWTCHSLFLLCFHLQTARTGGNWKVQFSLAWLTQTARRIQVVSAESLILCVCIYVKMYHFCLKGEKYFQLPALKIEMQGQRMSRCFCDLPCISCYYIKLKSKSFIIILLHTQAMKMETLSNTVLDHLRL